MANELLPCPFCGGEAEYDNSDSRGGGQWIQCKECSARVSSPYGDNSYSEKWNTRAAAPQPPAPNDKPACIGQLVYSGGGGINFGSVTAPNESTATLGGAPEPGIQASRETGGASAMDPAPGDYPALIRSLELSVQFAPRYEQQRIKDCITALTAQAARIKELERDVVTWKRQSAMHAKRREELLAQLAEARAKYNELIMAVAKKFPGESRHETALRYINLAETPQVNTPQAETKLTEGS